MSGMTRLHLAARDGNVDEMAALLEASAAAQGEALRQRFNTLETRLSARFEESLVQQLEDFRATHVLRRPNSATQEKELQRPTSIILLAL